MNIKFSIITVCYNAETSIEKTIQSVLKQSYQNYEYLIVDGKSTDKTLSIAQQYQDDKRVCIYSEKDKGIYNAMNKGITRVGGDYVYFLNAGDTFYSEKTLENIIMRLGKKRPHVFYGGVNDIYPGNRGSEIRFFGKPEVSKVMKSLMPCHQAIFARKDVITAHYFNESYAIRADFEFFVWAMKQKYTLFEVDEVVANYPKDGFSTCKTSKMKKKFTKETREILERYYPIRLKVQSILDEYNRK